jgi:phytanoyl-CoA hydroxylase
VTAYMWHGVCSIGAHARRTPSEPVRARLEAVNDRRREFERDGFLVVPDFASREACTELREAAEALIAETDLDALETVFDARGQAHGEDPVFAAPSRPEPEPSCSDPWFLESGGEVRAFLEAERDEGRPRVNKLGHALHDRLPRFGRFSRDPRLAELVAELGVVQPLLLQSMVILEHPRVGGAVPAHQDATYLYTEPVSVIGLWFALDDADLENGCLEVLPGGHRLGLRKRYRRSGDRATTEVLDARPWPLAGWRPLEVEAGTLVVFHGLLPHRSRANRSSRSRCAYTLHVIDGEAEYAADNWLQRPPDMPLRGF